MSSVIEPLAEKVEAEDRGIKNAIALTHDFLSVKGAKMNTLSLQNNRVYLSEITSKLIELFNIIERSKRLDKAFMKLSQ